MGYRIGAGLVLVLAAGCQHSDRVVSGDGARDAWTDSGAGDLVADKQVPLADLPGPEGDTSSPVADAPRDMPGADSEPPPLPICDLAHEKGEATWIGACNMDTVLSCGTGSTTKMTVTFDSARKAPGAADPHSVKLHAKCTDGSFGDVITITPSSGSGVASWDLSNMEHFHFRATSWVEDDAGWQDQCAGVTDRVNPWIVLFDGSTKMKIHPKSPLTQWRAGDASDPSPSWGTFKVPIKASDSGWSKELTVKPFAYDSVYQIEIHLDAYGDEYIVWFDDVYFSGKNDRLPACP